MVGAMLVGAWLLIHQQCCVTGEADSRNRNSLYDPLTRRSALEKNFMRFGRSMWTSADDFNQSETTAKVSFLRFGKSKTDGVTDFGVYGEGDEVELRATRADDNFLKARRDFHKERHPEGQYDETKPDLGGFSRFTKAKENFIRFGRNMDNFMRFGRNMDNFMRFGRSVDNFMRFGRAKDNFIRLGRNPDNFIRFGRNEGALADNGDYPRLKRGKDSFLRFGRNDGNFMRFGRFKNSLNGGNSDHIRLQPYENPAGRFTRSITDNILRNSRDRGLISFARQKEADKGGGFIRFGRSLKGERSRLDNEIHIASVNCKRKNYRLSRVESSSDDYIRELFARKIPEGPDFNHPGQNGMSPKLGPIPIGDSMQLQTVKLNDFFDYYSILMTKLHAIALE